jgi:16S rRNA (cytosine967-C5)-methyltransferase
VSEAVTIARAVSGERVSGFVNAVLRKLTKEPRPTAEQLTKAALDSAEPSLAKAIVDSVGMAGAVGLLAAGEPPPLGIRVENAADRDTWLARFREARPSASIEPGRVSPLAILVRGAGRITDLPGFGEGAWTSQEEGSQVVALALGAREGDVVLDACAGRGNKTGLLARAVGSRGSVDAADLHPNKLARLSRELERIALSVRGTFPVDWASGTGGATGPYDRVLVDAPCSGTGTIRRRPELLLRREAQDVGELAELQRAILGRVASLVRPGGRLVYAVCSILREEAEAVVAHAREHGLSPAPFDARIADAVSAITADSGVMTEAEQGGPSAATSFRLLPHVHGTDGYFVASFARD